MVERSTPRYTEASLVEMRRGVIGDLAGIQQTPVNLRSVRDASLSVLGPGGPCPVPFRGGHFGCAYRIDDRPTGKGGCRLLAARVLVLLWRQVMT
jgi:hypothetical protein